VNEKTLVICDKEARYAKGLGDNFSERKEFAFKVYACTSAESVRCFLDSHRIDVLIIDEGFGWEERESFGAEITFVLTKGICKDLKVDEVELFKYQCADAILADVVESYLRKSNVTILKNIKKQSKKMIAVYSPVKRIGKSTFAVALSRELGKEKKTLFLNMESYPSIVEGGKNLGDLLYYVRQEQDELGIRLASMVKSRDGLEYLLPIPMISDLKEVTVNEWKNLLERILEESIYENLVIDLDDSVDGLLEILKLCDWVYMPMLEEEVSHQKVCRFEEVLTCLGLEDILKKTTRFIAPEDMEGYARKLVREEAV
jgi:hypothetical protein